MVKKTDKCVGKPISSKKTVKENEPTDHSHELPPSNTVLLFTQLTDIGEAGIKDQAYITRLIENHQKLCRDIIAQHNGTIVEAASCLVVGLFERGDERTDFVAASINAALEIKETIKDYSRRAGCELRIRTSIDFDKRKTPGSVQATSSSGAIHLLEPAKHLIEICQVGKILVSSDIFKATKNSFDFHKRGYCFHTPGQYPSLCYEVIASKTFHNHIRKFKGLHLISITGRDRELDVILDCFEAVKKGEGRTLAVSGETGVGKTRLINELKRVFLHDKIRFHWLEGSCLPNFRYRPYYLFEQILFSFMNDIVIRHQNKRLYTIQERLREFHLKSEGQYHIEDALQYTFKDTSFSYLDGRKKQNFIAGHIVSILTDLASDEALIVIFDNLQDIDPISRTILETLIFTIKRHPILIFLTYRASFVPKWHGEDVFHQLNLGNFTRKETRDFLCHFLGIETIDQRIVDDLHLLTNGNPLFLEEILLNRKDSNDHTVPASLNDYRSFTKLALPDNLLGILETRIRTLSDEQRRILGYASLMGREFDADILDLMRNSPTQPDLEQLIEHGFIYRKGGLGRVFLFRNQLLCDLLFHRIDDEEAKLGHHRIALLFEKSLPEKFGSCFEPIAEHFKRANYIGEAYRYHCNLLDRAIANHDLEIAVHWLYITTSLFQKLPQQRRKEEYFSQNLRSLLIYRSRDDRPSYGRIASEMKSYIENQDDPEKKARFYLEIGIFEISNGNLARSNELLQHAVKLAEYCSNTALAIEIRRNLGIVYARMRRFKVAFATYRRCIADCPKNAAYLPLKGDILFAMTSVIQHLGDFNQAMEILNELLGIRKKLRDRRSYAMVCEEIALLHDRMGDKEKARSFCRKARHVHEELCDKEGLIVNLHRQARILLPVHPDRTITLAKEAMLLSERFGNHRLIVESYYLLSEIYQTQRMIELSHQYMLKGQLMAQEAGIKSDVS